MEFSQPVSFYVENFVGFSVGGPVPVGFYDRVTGQWIASTNGLVIAILSTTDGLAELDLTGTGAPASGAEYALHGISDFERQQLAELYTPGQTVWRVPIEHFSPFDCNWPVEPPEDAEGPDNPDPDTDDKEDDDCREGRSTIDCINQVLGESIAIVGTGSTLNYRSDRVPGRKAPFKLKIRLSGASVPASLQRIDLKIKVAGRRFKESFSPEPNQSTVFTWDGLGAYSRLLQGAQRVVVDTGYVYTPTYIEPEEFDFTRLFGRFIEAGLRVEGSRELNEITLWQTSIVNVGAWDIREAGLGGWSFNAHHNYDLIDRVLYLGNGERRSTGGNRVIEAFAGSGIVAPGGDYPRIGAGDGGPATEAEFLTIWDVAAGPDGSVYIPDYSTSRVRRVDPEGIITTFAGNGNCCYAGDGGPSRRCDNWRAPSSSRRSRRQRIHRRELGLPNSPREPGRGDHHGRGQRDPWLFRRRRPRHQRSIEQRGGTSSRSGWHPVFLGRIQRPRPRRGNRWNHYDCRG